MLFHPFPARKRANEDVSSDLFYAHRLSICVLKKIVRICKVSIERSSGITGLWFIAKHFRIKENPQQVGIGCQQKFGRFTTDPTPHLRTVLFPR
jgi:hypothetical protein